MEKTWQGTSLCQKPWCVAFICSTEQKPTGTCLGFNIRRLPARFFSTFQSGHEGSWKGVVQPKARGGAKNSGARAVPLAVPWKPCLPRMTLFYLRHDGQTSGSANWRRYILTFTRMCNVLHNGVVHIFHPRRIVLCPVCAGQT